MLFSRLARSTAIEQAREVRDLVKGLDLFIRGEHAGAAPILRRVVERDPDVEARAASAIASARWAIRRGHRHHFQVARLLGRDTLVVQLSTRDLLALGRADEAKERRSRRSRAQGLRRGAPAAPRVRASVGRPRDGLDAVRRLLGIDFDAAEQRRLETRLPRSSPSRPPPPRRIAAQAGAQSALETPDARERAPTSSPSGAGRLRRDTVLASLAAPRTGAGKRRTPAAATTSATERRAALPALPSARSAGARPSSRASRGFPAASARRRRASSVCSATTCGALGTIGEVDGALLKAVPTSPCATRSSGARST
jgi:hypothetical protein